MAGLAEKAMPIVLIVLLCGCTGIKCNQDNVGKEPMVSDGSSLLKENLQSVVDSDVVQRGTCPFHFANAIAPTLDDRSSILTKPRYDEIFSVGNIVYFREVNEANELFSRFYYLDIHSNECGEIKIPGTVSAYAMQKDHDRLWALAKRDNGIGYALYVGSWGGGGIGWKEIVPSRGHFPDVPIAFAVDKDHVFLTTGDSILYGKCRSSSAGIINCAGWNEFSLNELIPRKCSVLGDQGAANNMKNPHLSLVEMYGPNGKIVVSGDFVFLGYNNGEFGGALFSVPISDFEKGSFDSGRILAKMNVWRILAGENGKLWAWFKVQKDQFACDRLVRIGTDVNLSLERDLLISKKSDEKLQEFLKSLLFFEAEEMRKLVIDWQDVPNPAVAFSLDSKGFPWMAFGNGVVERFAKAGTKRLYRIDLGVDSNGEDREQHSGNTRITGFVVIGSYGKIIVSTSTRGVLRFDPVLSH